LVERTDEVPAALDDVRSVLHLLGFDDDDLTAELYTEAVAARRGASRPAPDRAHLTEHT
jgi:adenylate cyclase, class 2